jgi:hypothetical protein
VKDVERYGYNEAIISSNEVPKGIFITANRMLNFIYEKGADGKWTRLNRADLAIQWQAAVIAAVTGRLTANDSATGTARSRTGAARAG